TQEGLTQKIANEMEAALDPVGVAVIMPNVVHTCMSVRGVQERHASTTTSAMKGAFSDHERLARAELLTLLQL
ncbi:MAG: GTP cyclohydrolase I, partial [bacterium]